MKIRFCLSCLCLLVACGPKKMAVSEVVVGDHFLLKHTIYNIADSVTQVFAGDIIYSELCIENPYAPENQYPSPQTAAFVGSEIEIRKIVDNPKMIEFWCHVVSPESEPGDVPVHLQKQPDGSYLDAFQLLFSKDLDYRDDKFLRDQGRPKSRRDLIRYFGFPLSTCREGDTTTFYYNLWFLGFEVEGYNDVWFKLDKNGKVIEVSGII